MSIQIGDGTFVTTEDHWLILLQTGLDMLLHTLQQGRGTKVCLGPNQEQRSPHEQSHHVSDQVDDLIGTIQDFFSHVSTRSFVFGQDGKDLCISDETLKSLFLITNMVNCTYTRQNNSQCLPSHFADITHALTRYTRTHMSVCQAKPNKHEVHMNE